MTRETHTQWRTLWARAAASGIQLHVHWGYRSIDAQAEIVRAELARGVRMADVLRWVAAPGFSEHHSGRALDIGSPECDSAPRFEHTETFSWLQKEAPRLGFVMSYPAGNSYGVIYEPWHWCLPR